MQVKNIWWKFLAFLLVMYACIMGFLVPIPQQLPGVPLHHTIRNLFFHVPMWFGMMILFTVSLVYAIKYLKNPNTTFDFYSVKYAETGIVFGLLGIVTGAIWANFQWGAPWSSDPKQNGAAIALLIYLAYFVLRGSLTDEEKKARVGAVYNIFAYFMLFPTIWILPRLVESLHPGGQGGGGGNPALNGADLSAEMRLVFWPAVIGFTLLGVWVSNLQVRMKILQEKKLNES